MKGRELSSSAGLSIVGEPILRMPFKRQAHQLASCAHSRFAIELLQCCFYGTFRHVQGHSDSLVAGAFKNTFQTAFSRSLSEDFICLCSALHATPWTTGLTARGSSHISPSMTLRIASAS